MTLLEEWLLRHADQGSQLLKLFKHPSILADETADGSLKTVQTPTDYQPP
jgi:hypothetical protein